MPDHARDPDPAAEQAAEGPSPGEEAVSEVRYLPVPARGHAAAAAPAHPLDRLRADPLSPAIVAATGGFLAGVASWVLVRVLRRGGVRRPVAGRRRRRGRLDVAGTRSFLVDVHMLKR